MSDERFSKFLKMAGVEAEHNVIVHSAFSKIKAAFPGISPADVIRDLKNHLSKGSLIMPSFTYCFKRTGGDYEVLDKTGSPGKVGILSETFRMSEGVVRTSSPTHSFLLWGKAADEISELNNPASPLGENSVPDWLAKHENSFILMLSVDFSSLTFCHYLEVKAPVPWADYSPWEYMGVLKKGVSTEGETDLREVPGCGKPFINFEKNLLTEKVISRQNFQGMNYYYLPVKTIFSEGIKYFRNSADTLLCPEGSCRTCDSRRTAFLK